MALVGYAAAYVPSLPSDWQTFAASYKGKGNGDYYDFLNAILDWVKRKGLSDVTNSYTGKKVGGKAAIENQVVLAEAIAWSILKKGIKAQPFLYPASQQALPQLTADLKRIFDK